MAMAKKPSGKTTKAAKRVEKKAAARPKAKTTAAPKSARATKAAKGRAEKYEQPGAPWWKQHLPAD
jgi:hypothetical protein